MTPRILNLQVRALGATELCAPDVHYVPIGDDSIVAFDSNTLVAVEISKSQYEALTRPRESEVRPGQPPAAAENPPHALLFSTRRPKFDLSPDVSCRQLTLHLSDQCNQRCSYCWIKRKDEGASVMTREIAAAALSMFPSDGRDLRIGFFGGEPLLHFGMITLVCEMAEKLAARGKARALFHVTTNATLVTPLVARFLAKHGFSIIVSCDGPELLHDAARGEGSHAAMMRGLKMLRDAGCSGRTVLRGNLVRRAGGDPRSSGRTQSVVRRRTRRRRCARAGRGRRLRRRAPLRNPQRLQLVWPPRAIRRDAALAISRKDPPAHPLAAVPTQRVRRRTRLLQRRTDRADLRMPQTAEFGDRRHFGRRVPH